MLGHELRIFGVTGTGLYYVLLQCLCPAGEAVVYSTVFVWALALFLPVTDATNKGEDFPYAALWRCGLALILF